METKRSSIPCLSIIGTLVAILTMLFGDNLYQQLTHRSIFEFRESSTALPSENIVALPQINEKIVIQRMFSVKSNNLSDNLGGDGTSTYFTWYAKEGEKLGMIEILSPGQGTSVTSYVDVAEFFNDQNVQKYIVIVRTEIPDGTHMQPAIISGAVYSQTSTGWVLETEEHGITGVGQLGSAPKGEYTRIGPDKYGITYHDIYSGMGTYSENLVLITYINKKFSVILDVPLVRENGNGCENHNDLGPCSKYESTYEYIESSMSPNYYDFVVTEGGGYVDQNGNFIPALGKVTYYFFDGSKYIIYKGE